MRRLGIAMIAAGAVVFIAVALAVGFGGGPTSFDISIRSVLQGREVGAADLIAGGSQALAQLGLLSAILVLLARGAWVAPLAIAGADLTAAAAVGGLKELFHRARPSAQPHDSFAFPSGHATGAATDWGLLLLVALPLLLATTRPRWWGWAGWAIAALTISFARVAEDAHWATDVLAGCALALVCVGLAAVIATIPAKPIAWRQLMLRRAPR